MHVPTMQPVTQSQRQQLALANPTVALLKIMMAITMTYGAGVSDASIMKDQCGSAALRSMVANMVDLLDIVIGAFLAWVERGAWQDDEGGVIATNMDPMGRPVLGISATVLVQAVKWRYWATCVGFSGPKIGSDQYADEGTIWRILSPLWQEQTGVGPGKQGEPRLGWETPDRRAVLLEGWVHIGAPDAPYGGHIIAVDYWGVIHHNHLQWGKMSGGWEDTGDWTPERMTRDVLATMPFVSAVYYITLPTTEQVSNTRSRQAQPALLDRSNRVLQVAHQWVKDRKARRNYTAVRANVQSP